VELIYRSRTNPNDRTPFDRKSGNSFKKDYNMNLKLTGLALCLFKALYAQSPYATCDYTEFDFWLGEWNIQQEILEKNGNYLKLHANNTVEKIVGDCAILEKWNGDVQFFWEGMNEPEKLSAMSIRTFNEVDSTWSIYWIDSRSKKLSKPYIGKFNKQRGEFIRADETSLSKIIFYDITPDSVKWELQVFNRMNNAWTVVWKMKFIRK
jgi:hypothetical protein